MRKETPIHFRFRIKNIFISQIQTEEIQVKVTVPRKYKVLSDWKN